MQKPVDPETPKTKRKLFHIRDLQQDKLFATELWHSI